jgi:hypothetical protein
MANYEALIRQLNAKLNKVVAEHAQISHDYKSFVKACEDQPRSITEEIDSIPGRRIFYNLTAVQNFTIAQLGVRGANMNFLVSQDGPYIMTHYPLVIWKPNLPAGATNLGMWSAVSSWPIPTQQAAAPDRIDLSWEFTDAGSQRNFQNQTAGPLFSRPDNVVPLPVPTIFSPNTTIQFTPLFEDIFFAGPATPTTGGELVVTLPGYRIANL